MKFILHDLTIEVTRRTNEERCFQKGFPQNIDLTIDLVNALFESNEIERIDSLTFTGGEPTLNHEIIIYIIDKIIANEINVAKINITTNGKLINKELLQAFSRFNAYRNRLITNYTYEHIRDNRELADKIIRLSLNNHVQINISAEQTDFLKFKEEYEKNSFGLWIMKENIQNISENRVCNIPIKRELKDFLYSKELDAYAVSEKLYLTSTGYITNLTDVYYIDMDISNMGNIKDKSLQEMISEYGTPSFYTRKMTIEKSELKKQKLV